MKHTHSFYGHSFAEERRVYNFSSIEPVPTAATSAPEEGVDSDGKDEKRQVKEKTQSRLANLKKGAEQKTETKFLPGAKYRMMSLGNYRMEDGKLVKGTKGNEVEYYEYSFDPHPESITFIPITVDRNKILQVEYTFPGITIIGTDGKPLPGKIFKHILFLNEEGKITPSELYQTDNMDEIEQRISLERFIQMNVVPALRS